MERGEFVGWSDPGQAVKVELDCLSCSVFLYWQQNRNRSCWDTQTPEKNQQCLSTFPHWGHICAFLVDKPVPSHLQSLVMLSWGLGMGMALPLDQIHDGEPLEGSTAGKASPTASPGWWRGDVYLKNSVSSCSTSGYICKIGLFICHVKRTGIISFAVVPVEVQAILQEKKNYKLKYYLSIVTDSFSLFSLLVGYLSLTLICKKNHINNFKNKWFLLLLHPLSIQQKTPKPLSENS